MAPTITKNMIMSKLTIMEKTKKAYVAAPTQAQFLILLRIHMPARVSEDPGSATGCASTVTTLSPKYS